MRKPPALRQTTRDSPAAIIPQRGARGRRRRGEAEPEGRGGSGAGEPPRRARLRARRWRQPTKDDEAAGAIAEAAADRLERRAGERAKAEAVAKGSAGAGSARA